MRLAGGEVLVFGGSDPDTRAPLTSVERYIPAEHRWKAAADMHQQHACPAAALLRDGRVLVAGGCDVGSGTVSASVTAELYDPAADRWAPVGPLGEGRSDATATIMTDGRVLVVGGAVGAGLGMKPTSSTELYDPRTGRWISAPTPSRACLAHTATELADGRVLLLGCDGWPLVFSPPPG